MRKAAAIFFAVFLLPLTAAADIYSYTDANGVVAITIPQHAAFVLTTLRLG